MENKELSDIVREEVPKLLNNAGSWVKRYPEVVLVSALGTAHLGLGIYEYYKTKDLDVLIITGCVSLVLYSAALWCKAVKDRIYKFRASTQESEKHSIEINKWWDERRRYWNNKSKTY